jgi:hypothetical protein
MRGLTPVAAGRRLAIFLRPHASAQGLSLGPRRLHHRAPRLKLNSPTPIRAVALNGSGALQFSVPSLHAAVPMSGGLPRPRSSSGGAVALASSSAQHFVHAIRAA